ncbi:hypothetical protein [Actinoplanes sp. URMC 104]|uniref:hypothetical protein n=1 Tax=Actinoplanes sp. URMC 104 TaxID=3423409 RepID=UPI003F1DF797
MPPAAEEEPGLLASSMATLRLIVGWALVALGVLNLAMGLVSVSYVVFHVVLLVTGLLLLGVSRLGRRPARLAWIAGGLVAGLGLVAGAIPALAVGCCSPGYAVRHGYPFTMLARDPGGWRFDAARTVADLLFWLCAGMIVMVVADRLLPSPRRSEPRRPGKTPRPSMHAEERNAGQPSREHRARAADDENVGGLP